MGKKLTNFQKEKKNDFLGPKNKPGQKIDQFKKKKQKTEFWGKNKPRLSLRRRNSFFGPKIGEKFDNKVQKLPNFKEKKGFFRPKKQSGAELKNKKKRFFG